MSSDDEVEFLSEKNTTKGRHLLEEEVILSSDDECEYKKHSRDNDQTFSGTENENEDEEDDENLPSGAECMKRCREFASITETDTALAMFYLQNNKWDLELQKKIVEKRLLPVLTSKNWTEMKIKRKAQEDATDSKKTKSDQTEEIGHKNNQINQVKPLEGTSESLKETRFKVLSWNIDGIDDTSIEARALGVSQKILAELPDLVLLQEVVYENETVLREKLSKFYEFNTGNMQETGVNYSAAKNYYTMILSKKQTCKCLGKNLVNYGNSVMGRNLLQVKVNYMGKVDMCVMTTHLESTKEYAKQRVDQLKMAFKEVLEQDEKTLVILGGDLNLRDTELTAIGGLPKGVYDLWESTGSRKECLYTWDTSRNTNLQWPGKFKPKLRFDRIYFRANKGANTLVPVYFELEGLEKLKTCSRFCSDHWAIQSYFDLKLNNDD